MLAFLSFFFYNKLVKTQRTDKPQSLSNRYTWHSGWPKAMEAHLGPLQRAFTEKPGFAREPGAQAEVDNAAQAKHMSTDSPILRLVSRSLLNSQTRTVLSLRKKTHQAPEF